MNRWDQAQAALDGIKSTMATIRDRVDAGLVSVEDATAKLDAIKVMSKTMMIERYMKTCTQVQRDCIDTYLGENPPHCTLANGGNQCIRGNTLIDTPERQIQVQDFEGGLVNSWKDGKPCVRCASPSFIKGFEQFYRVEFSNGHTMEVTRHHRFLTPTGYATLEALLKSSGVSLPNDEALLSNALHWKKTIPGSRCDCPVCRHCDDVQPPCGRDNDRDAAPLSGDAHEHKACHTCPCCKHSDAQEHNKAYSHSCQCECRHANRDDQRQTLDHDADSLCPSACTDSLQPCPCSPSTSQPADASSHLPRSVSSGQTSRTLSCKCVPYVVSSGGSTYITSIEATCQDDVWDITVEDTECYASGGIISHNSGKSRSAAIALASYIRDHAPNNTIVWCIAPNAEKSKGTQQKYLWDLLPRERLGRFSWEPKNGFGSEGPMLIFDEGKRNIQVYFKTQSQYDADPDSFESATIDRIWIDEVISDPAWQALQMRILMRQGKFLVSTYLGKVSVEWAFEAARSTDPTIFKTFEMKPRDNPIAHASMFDTLKKVLSPEEWRVRVEGKARLESMLVMDRFDPALNVVKERPQADYTWFAGMDIGYDHPTTWVLIGCSPDGDIIVDEEICMRKASVKEVVNEINRKLNGRVLYWPTVVDNAAYAQKDHRNTMAKEYELAGLRTIRSLGKSQERERAQIEQINELLESGTLTIMDRCRELVRELQTWKYKRMKDGSFLTNEMAEDKNNDVIDALRYILAKKPAHAKWLKHKTTILSDNDANRKIINDPILDSMLRVNPDAWQQPGLLHRMYLQSQEQLHSQMDQATHSCY